MIEIFKTENLFIFLYKIAEDKFIFVSFLLQKKKQANKNTHPPHTNYTNKQKQLLLIVVLILCYQIIPFYLFLHLFHIYL